jgi:hypothetical protein
MSVRIVHSVNNFTEDTNLYGLNNRKRDYARLADCSLNFIVSTRPCLTA